MEIGKIIDIFLISPQIYGMDTIFTQNIRAQLFKTNDVIS